jgi:hypothetical protein
MVTSERRVFIEGITNLMSKYQAKAVDTVRREEKFLQADGILMADFTAEVTRVLLNEFWEVAIADAQLSIYLVPVMAFLKKSLRDKNQRIAS